MKFQEKCDLFIKNFSNFIKNDTSTQVFSREF